MSFNYNVIYDFCKVRNNGTAMKNGTAEYPPRVKFIIDLLEKLGIEYEVDTWEYSGGRFSLGSTNLHNIYLKGSSDNWLMAHHDVCNHRIDNANDNSASVINAIALKTLRPEMNVALVDAEEPPILGGGSRHFADLVKNGTLKCNWVLNLELTGSGGTNFFIGNYKTEITKRIHEIFGCAITNTPPNDAGIMISYAGINAALINPVPLKKESENIVVKQLGVLEDLINDSKDPFSWNDEIDDVFDKLDEFDEDDSKLTPEERKLLSEFGITGYKVDTDFSEYKGLKVGDIISVEDERYIRRELGFVYDVSKLSDSEKFITQRETVEIKLEPGKMPTVDQLDMSILYRCHSSDDTVEHLVIEDMKDFVEKVICKICDEA